MGYPRRYPKQPWTYDLKDLLPAGDPETVVFLPGGETLLGLHIVGLPNGDAMLGIKCDELGRPEGCGFGTDLTVEVIPVQSNPKRVFDSDDAEAIS